uniref:5-oxoprolinase n=1 Tax=Syphacia muris TaxID=451379 RepID=A0A158R5F5_9BILA
MPINAEEKYGFAIDRGGTFTDVYVRCPDGSSRTLKLLSENPAYKDAAIEAIRRVLEKELGVPIPKDKPIPTGNISWIRLGTTVATNALLERKGERTALFITKGFKDLLYIGNQSRPHIFDFKMNFPDVLYEEVVEVDERVILEDKMCTMAVNGKRERTKNDEQAVYDKGIQSIAVVLLHSYIYPKHEEIIGELARKCGFANVSLSSSIMPMIKIVPRGYTACADAYLTPIVHKYIKQFCAGFESLKDVSVETMQSDGGLCIVENFCGSRAILSGPAAGVVGVSLTAYDSVCGTPIIGFDMGGTSTDVSRYAGEFDHVMETTTAGITIQAPQLDIHTVAAGGGSRLFFQSGLFVVGPESAGAFPGPICYRNNGHLALTDVNLVLGRILPEYFPKIFGKNEDDSLDKNASIEAMQKLTDEINSYCKKNNLGDFRPLSIYEVALGFVRVANESMCRPIRALTQEKGYDTSQHMLACFGGAGGQHACAIAKSLGLKTVLVHRYSGILSAYGLALADIVQEVQEPARKSFSLENYNYFRSRILALRNRCAIELEKMRVRGETAFQCYLNMRYDRTDCSIMCLYSVTDNNNIEEYQTVFENLYFKEFGFILPSREIIVDDIRIRGTVKRCLVESEKVEHKEVTAPVVESVTSCYFEEGKLQTNVYKLSSLIPKQVIDGPALLIDENSTILVEPNCEACITEAGDVKITVGKKVFQDIGINCDPIQLSIFSHRFMSIAEQMGRVLKRTAISTNIKERLDFSCALFTPEGHLIANAPHIPVHLGAMQASISYQFQKLGVENLNDGDVILCNHPKAGGSHLPDLTVITPVLKIKKIYSRRPVFFVANRGHHADIGGLVPGSMPPQSTCLAQEGATFVSFKIVDRGVFKEEELIKLLNAPASVPGCSGSRNLSDNLSDLRAQIAANQKGIKLVCELIDAYGLDVVHAYMKHIENNAEVEVRNLLKQIANEDKTDFDARILKAKDFMDDGTPICITISIHKKTGDAVFDFEGTGPEVLSNCNAPPSVTMAAVIYCLRCLVKRSIPLNQGCLLPVVIKIPPGSLLSPSEDSAVVSGNVLTSQRICDVIFKAFDVVAASQGCMNNVTFGDEKMGGYYETIAGGAGAGPDFHGRSAVHTHMTNTRITDPEVLETRYPVILREFSVRSGSGGKGKFNGGDGCIRRIQFRKPLLVSVLSERRAFAPYGLHGGLPGERGLNILQKRQGRRVNIGGKISLNADPGDILEIYTPGGGGYGVPDDYDAKVAEFF